MENKVNRIDNYVIEVSRVAEVLPIFEAYIRLDGEHRSRMAGTYFLETGTFTTIRKNEHVFRKTNSWGINADMLAMLDSLKEIHILNEDTKEVFKTTYENFLKNAQAFNFKFSGYDKQKFLPLSMWEREKYK